jgi:hypothetical protein
MKKMHLAAVVVSFAASMILSLSAVAETPTENPRGTEESSSAQDAGAATPEESTESTTAPLEARWSCRMDYCNSPHDSCTCSNTGWSGYCGTGPHHPGCLYCRCD